MSYAQRTHRLYLCLLFSAHCLFDISYLTKDVRHDANNIFDRLVPENAKYLHTDEGSDDMPAHGKSSLVGMLPQLYTEIFMIFKAYCTGWQGNDETNLTGTNLTIPIRDGKLALGTWQGIWLCEFRDRGGMFAHYVFHSSRWQHSLFEMFCLCKCL